MSKNKARHAKLRGKEKPNKSMQRDSSFRFASFVAADFQRSARET